jgi:hypothetical protein
LIGQNQANWLPPVGWRIRSFIGKFFNNVKKNEAAVLHAYLVHAGSLVKPTMSLIPRIARIGYSFHATRRKINATQFHLDYGQVPRILAPLLNCFDAFDLLTRKPLVATARPVTIGWLLDDLGIRKLPLTAAEELLEIIMRRYERASTLLTSNRPVEDGGKLLGDSAAVPAMLDRLLRHGHVLKCGPRSWRTKTSSPGESQ